MLFRRFRSDRRGAITPTFALMMIPLMAAIGSAVDYGMAAKVRTQLLAAADAASVGSVGKASPALSAAALMSSDGDIAAGSTDATTIFNAEIIGISVDGPWCHLAFAHDRKLRFPLLADFEPKGEVARAYGVYRAHEGISERALFVIDSKGTIRWSYVSPVGINPGADGILTALESIDTKGNAL